MTGLAMLAPTVVDRFVKVAGMLGSDHDGEILNAARAGTKLLWDAGLTWRDALTPSSVSPHQFRQRRSAEDVEPVRPTPAGWRKVMLCLHLPTIFNAMEAKFLADMSGLYQRGRSPSEKQSAWIDRLHVRATLSDAERGS